MQVVANCWVFLLLGGHVGAVLLLLRWSPFTGQDLIWKKVTTQPINDIKLLVACLAWPPSCFVSDATDRTGTHSAPPSLHRWALRPARIHASGMCVLRGGALVRTLQERVDLPLIAVIPGRVRKKKTYPSVHPPGPMRWVTGMSSNRQVLT